MSRISVGAEYVSNNDAATNENMTVETSLVGCGLHIAAETWACRWIFHRTGSRVNENKNIAVIPSDPLSIQSATSSAYASFLLLASLQENSEENNNREEKKPTDDIAQENSSGNETRREDVDLLIKRVTQLEHIVAMQEVELVKLRRECDALTEATSVFAHVVEMLGWTQPCRQM